MGEEVSIGILEGESLEMSTRSIDTSDTEEQVLKVTDEEKERKMKDFSLICFQGRKKNQIIKPRMRRVTTRRESRKGKKR